ncbi:CYIR protein, partial [Plasmodium cynomolgi strain B]
YQVQEECCHWGASFCPDYFLNCNDVYNPSRLLSLLKYYDEEACKVGTEDSYETAELNVSPPSKGRVDMYIKYLKCAEVTEENFKGTAIVCQQPGYRPHLSNSLMDMKRKGKTIHSNSNRPIHQLKINEKPVNVVLISNQDYNYYVTNSDMSTPEGIYTLFPEITGNERDDYENEGKEDCTKKNLPEYMKLYCERSRENREYLNKFEYKNESTVDITDKIPALDDEPLSTSFFTVELLKKLPFRASIMVILLLLVIMVFFLYYKVKNNSSLIYKHFLSLFFINFYELFYYENCNLLSYIYIFAFSFYTSLPPSEVG